MASAWAQRQPHQHGRTQGIPVPRADLRHVNTNSDSEVLLNVLAHELSGAWCRAAAQSGHHIRCGSGAYMRAAKAPTPCRPSFRAWLLAFRDPTGIRRLVIGHQRPGHPARIHCRLGKRGHRRAGLPPVAGCRARAKPLFIDFQRQMHSRQCKRQARAQPLHFRNTFTSLARIRSSTAYPFTARAWPWACRSRENPARACRSPDRRGDPDSGYQPPIALQLANHLNVPYREGFIKNRYIGRTFIYAGAGAAQKVRASKTQRYCRRIQRQERPAGRRLHRAWHHQP